MSQVSKRFVNNKIQDRISSLFISGIILTQSKEEADSFIEDLFTPTERIMLAKRFSIAFMLLEGYDYESIKQVLKVSGSTISNVSYWLKSKGKGIRSIVKKIKKSESTRKFWDEIGETIFEILSTTKQVNSSLQKKSLNQLKASNKNPF